MDKKVSEFSSMTADGEGSVLDREISLEEIAVCVRKLKNNKTGGSDGLVGELLKYSYHQKLYQHCMYLTLDNASTTHLAYP